MILDTNALSAWAKNDERLLHALRGDRPWFLPSIVIGEFRYGILGSTKRNELEEWMNAVEAACTILAADGITAKYYAELRQVLGATRHSIPYHDLWIGALSLQHDLEVVTRDAHFEQMPGVRVIKW